MAFGVSPKYIQQISLGELTSTHFIILMIEAAKKSGWDIGYINDAGFIAYTGFSMSSWSEEVKVKVDSETASLKSECTGNQIVDWGKNKRNITLLLENFELVKTQHTAEELDEKYAQLQSERNEQEEDLLSAPPLTGKEKFVNFLSLFKPTEGYFITPILININILIFILMVISGVGIFVPNTQGLLLWGANFSPLTLNGQWWRLFTNCFIHIGIIHIAFNMYALAYIGVMLEPHLGKARFLAAYLLTGLTASVTSLWWHSLVISAGASGAIFGMYGVFLAMLTTNLIERSARKSLLTSIGIFVVYNLANGMKSGVDNAAHIGGLVGGLIIGYGFVSSLKKPYDNGLNYATIVIISGFTIAACAAFYKQIPNDLVEYDRRFKKFNTNEAIALGVYRMDRSATKDQILSEINDRGIFYWQENIKVINELEKLNLPPLIHDRDEKLVDYCNLRIRSYHLLYNAVKEDTPIYKDSIKIYNEEIETVLNGLKEQ